MYFQKRFGSVLDPIDDEFLTIYLKNNKENVYSLPALIDENTDLKWKGINPDKIDYTIHNKIDDKSGILIVSDNKTYEFEDIQNNINDTKDQSDAQKLSSIIEIIKKMIFLVNKYISLDALLNKQYSKLAENGLELIIRFLQISDYEKIIDEIIDNMAQKEIFLEDTRGNKRITRFLRKIFTNGVKKDLLNLEEKYKKFYEDCCIAVNQYNYLSNKILKQIKSSELTETKNNYLHLSLIINKYKHLEVSLKETGEKLTCDISLKEFKNANDNLIDFYSKCRNYLENLGMLTLS